MPALPVQPNLSPCLPTITENRIVTGLLPGFNHAVAVVKIHFPAQGPEPTRLQAIDRLLAEFLPGYTPQWKGGGFTRRDLDQWLLLVIDLLHDHTLAPKLAKGRVEALLPDDKEGWVSCLLYPVLGPQHGAVNFALHWLISLIGVAQAQLAPTFKSSLPRVLEYFANQTPSSVGLAHFLAAADKAGIPWQHISHNVYQYGWGKHARLLDGTFTDQTSNIASRICLHKNVLNPVLRAAGIPVPTQISIPDENQAMQAAEKLGFPVVVKPVDRDRGEGVSTNLQSLPAIRQAMDRARQFSKRLVMENHCPGEDYRIYVMNDEVLLVICRIPGRVIGNGTDTVKALLVTLNADPLRQPAAGRRKQIPLDAEALDLLQQQGLTPDSIPANGQKVVLRRTPNMTTGAESREIAFADIHPDNLALFLRTARLLRLDIAGIDFLSVDISQSWLDNGAVICEVNSQPQHPPYLAEAILGRVVTGNGRVPVVVVVENRNHVAWLDTLLNTLHEQGCCTGVARADRLELDRQVIQKGHFDAPLAAQILLRDPALDCLVIQISDVGMLSNGLPVDCIDVLVLSGITGFPARLQELADELGSRSRHLIIDTSSSLWKQAKPRFQTPELCPEQQLQPRLLAMISAIIQGSGS